MNKSVGGYATAADAKSGKNKKTTVKAGVYFLFNTSGDMINVTTKNGTPGSWINPTDNGSGSASAAPTTLKVGQRVKLKSSASKYATGQKISASIKNKTYTIQQVKSDRVLLKEIYSWVKISDVQ
ncbi:hypothetical protein [Bacillus sp. FSL K6-3431]|uniref:hypothetical protein n=1 Tax=Bacillus sp. FSL K6-3431 TaxID=2921500 RepID=UPI0030F5CCA2